MSPSKTVETKTYIFLILMTWFASVGTVLLRVGMKRIGEVNDWSPEGLTHLFLQVFTNGWIWFGIGNLLLFFLSFLLVLTWADYSYVFPASAVGYLLVAFLGYSLLGETVSGLRWAGVACICLGVLFVGQTPPQTTRQE